MKRSAWLAALALLVLGLLLSTTRTSSVVAATSRASAGAVTPARPLVDTPTPELTPTPTGTPTPTETPVPTETPTPMDTPTITSTPRPYAISINGGALYTNIVDVLISLSAPDAITQMMISNDGGFEGRVWEPFVPVKAWQITQYNETVVNRVVYVRFGTSVGDILETGQDDIILDVTAPTGSLTITEPGYNAFGTLPVPAASLPLTLPTASRVLLPLITGENTGSWPVLLRLKATDTVSGVGTMMLATRADFAGAQWQPYRTSLPWAVAEQGTTTVYARFKDRAGNVSEIASDTVTVP